MSHSKMKTKDGTFKIIKKGLYKFVDSVSKVTCSGKEALKQGKFVYYCSNVGIFI